MFFTIACKFKVIHRVRQKNRQQMYEMYKEVSITALDII